MAGFCFLKDVLYAVIVQIFGMALVIYDTHNIHFHMDAAQLVALAQSYFAHNDYLLVCYGI